MPRAAGLALLLVAVLCGASGFGSIWDRRLPRLVFVSRAPVHGGLVAGIGPSGRTLAPGGALLVRERSGRVHPLLADGAFHDVSDPSVSWDGTRVAFAATVAPDSAWRIWIVGADGSGLRPLTRDDSPITVGEPVTPGHYATEQPRYPWRVDDFDPCWLPDGRVCFASTRFPQVSQQGRYPVSNLFVIRDDGTDLRRLTTERNGAEAPSIDPRNGRIVYTRWWFNRYRPSNGPSGVTTDFANAVPADTVDLWHAVSIATDGDGIKLAGGDPRNRRGQMAYAPRVLADGTLIGVSAANASLDGAPGRLEIVEYPGGFAARRPLSAAPAAIDPVPLPDGRLLCAVDRAGTGDFALCVLDPAHPGAPRVIYDREGTCEMEAEVLGPRPRPPVMPPGLIDPPPAAPFTKVDQLHDHVHTFRFDCLNVFANGPLDTVFPDAPPLQQDVRIRFFATLSRPNAAGGDTLVLVREAAVSAVGAVHEDDMPADVPMFEQLVDSKGRVLRSATGPAHVPGLNFARFGSGTKCVGCHAGHSALQVPVNYTTAGWVNASTSATVTASGLLEGTAGPRAAVDRRARGPIDDVAWVADSAKGAWLRLEWSTPIEVRSVVLYACRADRARAADPRVDAAEVRLFRAGRLQNTLRHDARLETGGTALDCDPTTVDAIEIRPLRVSGSVKGRHVAALAEVETIARLAR